MKLASSTFSTRFPYPNQTPPRKVASFNSDLGSALRGLAFSERDSHIYTCSSYDGSILGISVENLKGDPRLNKLFISRGEKGARVIEHIPHLKQLVVGFSGGLVAVYDLKNPAMPIYSHKIHSSDINQIKYIPESKLLITASKDKFLKFYKMKAEANEPLAPSLQQKTSPQTIGSSAQVRRQINNYSDDDEEAPGYVKPSQSNQASKVIPDRKVEKSGETNFVKAVAVQKKEDSDDDLSGWNN